MEINITKKIDDENVIFVMAEGKIDLETATEYGTTVSDAIEDNDAREVILDFSKITYISSIGLRIILELHKKMQEIGVLKIKNVSQDILNIFNMTGFSKFLNIE